MIGLIKYILSKKKFNELQKKREETKSALDTNEKKLFELFNSVLKHHTYLFKDGTEIEISDGVTSMFITSNATLTNEISFFLIKDDGSFVEMSVNNVKFFVFLDEINKVLKKKSIRSQIERKMALKNQLDQLIQKENQAHQEDEKREV